MQKKQKLYPLDKSIIRKIKVVLFALTALLLSWPVVVCVFAENRNIFIGDIITLQISSRELSAEELKAKFQAFEIVEIKDKNGEYLVSLRTFETGEHKILLRDKEIVINVQSVLDSIQREGIFEGDTGVTGLGFLFHWDVIFYIAAGLFVLSGGYVLIKALLKGKIKTLSPYQIFLKRSASLSAENDDYFVDLTLYFKEYLECLHHTNSQSNECFVVFAPLAQRRSYLRLRGGSQKPPRLRLISNWYQFRIIGKTSVEIVNELKEISILNTMLPDIKAWLTECDRLKFTGISVSMGTKNEHYEKLLKLVEKVEELENIDAHDSLEGKV